MFNLSQSIACLLLSSPPIFPQILVIVRLLLQSSLVRHFSPLRCMFCMTASCGMKTSNTSLISLPPDEVCGSGQQRRQWPVDTRTDTHLSFVLTHSSSIVQNEDKESAAFLASQFERSFSPSSLLTESRCVLGKCRRFEIFGHGGHHTYFAGCWPAMRMDVWTYTYTSYISIFSPYYSMA